jgi:hypothetical protein
MFNFEICSYVNESEYLYKVLKLQDEKTDVKADAIYINKQSFCTYLFFVLFFRFVCIITLTQWRR